MEQKDDKIIRFYTRREEGDAIHLKSFICELISYRRWFIPCIIIGIGVAVIYNSYIPATYAVSGTLFVEEKNEESISLNTIFDNIQLKQDVKIPNHLGILKSFSLNRQVIENLGWDEEDKDALALDYIERLEVTRLDKNMDLISIWLKTKYPQKDVKYVNALEDAYIAYGIKQKNQASENTIRFINGQLAAVADTLGKNSDLYAYLLEKRSEAEITRASNVSDVEIVDRATESTVVEVAPRKIINLLLGMFFGFAVPFLMIILKDFFNETVGHERELEKLSPLPVLGRIRHSPYSDKIPVIQYGRSLISESFRELRTNLENLFQEKNVLVAGVHSIIPREGKSFVALNLACIVAMNNRKVILISADMRKPDVHGWLGLSNQHGLSSYLEGSDTVDEVILKTRIPNLHLIPSGPVLPNPAEFLDTNEFEFLINELKTRYNMILLDNAPLGVVNEGAIIRRHSDIDLFVIRQGYSSKKLLDEVNKLTIQEMEKAAIILNDVRVEKDCKQKKNQYYENEYFTDVPLMDVKLKKRADR
ncbi:MAG: polysaccharide biosynthesis tyrosine autokinase [Prolixibacteraceae bacterium]